MRAVLRIHQRHGGGPYVRPVRSPGDGSRQRFEQVDPWQRMRDAAKQSAVGRRGLRAPPPSNATSARLEGPHP